MMGLEPMLNEAVPVGMVQVAAPCGLQIPRFTAPPAAKGRAASATVGTVIVKMMFEALTTLAAKLVLATIELPATTPTLVFWVGSVLGTNPVPISTTVSVVPAGEVGRLAGVIELRVAPGAWTVMLKVTTRVVAGLPEVMDTVPVRTLPAGAAAKTSGSKVTGIGVPKL